MAYAGEIPFIADTQLHYPETWRDSLAWKPNHEFEGTLIYQGYQRGRSAAYFSFRVKETGRYVTMFMTDFDAMVQAGRLRGLEVSYGKWTFCKKGQNYGVCPVEV